MIYTSHLVFLWCNLQVEGRMSMFLGWRKFVKPPGFWYGNIFRSVKWEAAEEIDVGHGETGHDYGMCMAVCMDKLQKEVLLLKLLMLVTCYFTYEFQILYQTAVFSLQLDLKSWQNSFILGQGSSRIWCSYSAYYDVPRNIFGHNNL